LYRHTQQSELCVGVWQDDFDGSALLEPAASAAHLRLVRCEFGDDTTFIDVVAAVRRELAQGGSPSKMVEMSGANVLFGMGRARDGATPAGMPVDISLTLEDGDGKLRLRLEYAGQLFLRERVRELLAQFEHLVEQVATSPEREVIDYSLLTPFGRTVIPDPTLALEKPRYPLLTESFLDCAGRKPADVAIRQGGQSWTYAELASSSAALAAELCHRGVNPGEVVAVAGQRSFAIVSSMLGVFRSGATLLTLDPKLPLERRKVMMEQAGAKRLVCVGDFGEGASSAVDVVQVDATSGVVRGEVSDGIAPSQLPVIEPQWPAYVFYTSGSTGVPKAVLGRHEGLGHFLEWQRRTFEIKPEDRASQLTALSFDVVLRDMFLALTSGATLCIPRDSDVLDPARIISWMDQERITVLHVVPSLARLWLNYVPPGVRLPHLRRVFFAGEPLTDVLIRRFRDAFGDKAALINLYGPTETTLAKCYHRIPASPEPGVQPIGQAQPQTQVLILNRRRRLCGLNETGEIAIRTPFRTLGYLNAPDANARAFIANPYRDDVEDLVYLTGDSGRYRTDGILEILGRIDNQVKIRGMRVEPGEIEATLGHHPNVREAVVVAREDASGGKLLIAYVVLRSSAAKRGSSEHVVDLREFLRGRLPEHMVPSGFVVLDTLPLNANGKINKKALPAVDRASLSGANYAAPTDELEAGLVRIWEELLRVDHIGIDDRFFDIGGHSLLAVQLAQAIEVKLQRSCPLPMVFESGTVRALAARLRTGTAGLGGPAASDGTVIPLQVIGTGRQVFCICGVTLYQALANRLAPEFRTYGIFLPYEQALLQDPARAGRMPPVEEIAAEYLLAVRRQQPSGPYMLAGVSFGGVLAYEMAQQLVRAGQQVDLVAILDSMLPSALRRNWVRWVIEKARRTGSQKLQTSVSQAKRPLWGERSQKHFPAGAAAADPTEAEARRLAFTRETAYKAATARYRTRPYSGKALLVRAQDKSFFESDIADSTYGWGSLVAELEVCDVPGDHIGILSEPHVAQLARQLRSHMQHIPGK
jgi:amino acid adenylation domain-containing protein